MARIIKGKESHSAASNSKITVEVVVPDRFDLPYTSTHSHLQAFAESFNSETVGLVPVFLNFKRLTESWNFKVQVTFLYYSISRLDELFAESEDTSALSCSD